MRKFLFLLALAAAALGTAPGASAAEPSTKNKRLLLVTHSGGFIHGSVATAEQVLKEIGPKNGFDVTCWRFTGDPNAKDKSGKSALEAYSERFRGATRLPVGPENCGRINKDTLKNFDVVLFFTTGNPVTKEELADLREWVKNGGALAGTHCATDTLYGESVYGDLIGAYFRGHPPGLQKIKIHVEDPNHPAAVGVEDGQEYKDEIYIFTDEPYSRDKLHIILSCEKGSFKEAKDSRKDGDYAISWCREEGKGKVFYTSLGHDKRVWRDEKFQQHLVGGLAWATGQAKGDATPTGKAK